MGSKYAKSNNEEINQKTNNVKAYKNNKDYKCETEDISINLQTKENTDNSSVNTTTDIFENSKLKNDFVPFKFEWKGNGSKVILAGSFLNNWTTFLNMEKNGKTGIFEKFLYLPRNKHEFKFIVDNNWTCSNQYETIPNQYNGLNNYIDLTNNILPDKINKNEENKNQINIEEKKSKKSKKIYNCKYPLINELNTTAPYVIEHYRPCFNIDYQSRQDIIEFLNKFKYLKYKENNFNTENNTSRKIMVWPHEKLMHLCPNLEDIFEENEHNFRTCTTIRNKHKYLTIVYYKPKLN